MKKLIRKAWILLFCVMLCAGTVFAESTEQESIESTGRTEEENTESAEERSMESADAEDTEKTLPEEESAEFGQAISDQTITAVVKIQDGALKATLEFSEEDTAITNSEWQIVSYYLYEKSEGKKALLEIDRVKFSGENLKDGSYKIDAINTIPETDEDSSLSVSYDKECTYIQILWLKDEGWETVYFGVPTFRGEKLEDKISVSIASESADSIESSTEQNTPEMPQDQRVNIVDMAEQGGGLPFSQRILEEQSSQTPSKPQSVDGKMADPQSLETGYEECYLEVTCEKTDIDSMLVKLSHAEDLLQVQYEMVDGVYEFEENEVFLPEGPVLYLVQSMDSENLILVRSADGTAAIGTSAATEEILGGTEEETSDSTEAGGMIAAEEETSDSIEAGEMPAAEAETPDSTEAGESTTIEMETSASEEDMEEVLSFDSDAQAEATATGEGLEADNIPSGTDVSEDAMDSSASGTDASADSADSSIDEAELFEDSADSSANGAGASKDIIDSSVDGADASADGIDSSADDAVASESQAVTEAPTPTVEVLEGTEEAARDQEEKLFPILLAILAVVLLVTIIVVILAATSKSRNKKKSRAYLDEFGSLAGQKSFAQDLSKNPTAPNATMLQNPAAAQNMNMQQNANAPQNFGALQNQNTPGNSQILEMEDSYYDEFGDDEEDTLIPGMNTEKIARGLGDIPDSLPVRIFAVQSVVVNNKGRIRKNNEDNFYMHGAYMAREAMDEGAFLHGSSKDAVQLYAVCDGMGGADSGEEASHCAVKELSLRKEEHPGWMNQRRMTDAIRSISDTVYEEAEKRGQRSGTTIVMMLLKNGYAQFSNVGDSRIYRFRDQRLAQISLDHSKVQRMISMGILTPEQARKDPSRHVITQYLGMPPEMKASPYYAVDAELRSGDVILLCSDGLSDMVEDAQMEAIMQNQKDLRSCAQELLNAALMNGGRDNVTIMLVQVTEEPKNEESKRIV